MIRIGNMPRETSSRRSSATSHVVVGPLPSSSTSTKSQTLGQADAANGIIRRVSNANRTAADALALLGRPNPHREANRTLGGLDPSMSGSKDLSGQAKPPIEHHRCEDRAKMESKYRTGRKLGQYVFC